MRNQEPDRSFEDLLKRLLSPPPKLKEAFEAERVLDETGRALSKKRRFKARPKSPTDLAASLAMKRDTFHNKLDGNSRFWAFEARDILAQVHDIELANYFLKNTPFMVTHRVDLDDQTTSMLERLLSNALVHVAELTLVVDRVLGDGKLDNSEKPLFIRKIIELETAIAAVRNQLEPTPDLQDHIEPSPPPADY